MQLRWARVRSTQSFESWWLGLRAFLSLQPACCWRGDWILFWSYFLGEPSLPKPQVVIPQVLQLKIISSDPRVDLCWCAIRLLLGRALDFFGIPRLLIVVHRRGWKNHLRVWFASLVSRIPLSICYCCYLCSVNQQDYSVSLDYISTISLLLVCW